MTLKAGRVRMKSGEDISGYALGDMTSTVYSVNGGMEDWAYGASWDSEADGTIY